MSIGEDPTTEIVPVLGIQELRRHLSGLQQRLDSFVERNPDHLVDGVALGLVDTLIANAAIWFDGHPIIERLASGRAELAENRPAARAADLLIAVDLLLHSLPPTD